jgi:hypothetical protein
LLLELALELLIAHKALQLQDLLLEITNLALAFLSFINERLHFGKALLAFFLQPVYS